MPTKKVTKKAPAKKTTAKKAVKKASVKKTVKKTTVKKPVSKKSVKKTAKKAGGKKTKKELVYSDNKTSFWVTDGQILNSLVALRDALAEMEKEVYSYHAGKAHNHFADWVNDVLADAKCATELKKAMTPKSAKTVVVKHLKFYVV